MTQAQSIPTLARRPIEEAQANGQLPVEIYKPRSQLPQAKATGKPKRYAVCFYARKHDPLLFPPFPYAVIGTVLEYTRILAFVEAYCHVGAMILVDQYFGEAIEIESVEDGWQRLDDVRGNLKGNVSDVQRQEKSLLAWLKSFFTK